MIHRVRRVFSGLRRQRFSWWECADMAVAFGP
jgi:hypothetical protein